MLSEKHSAIFISFWLSEWVEKVQLPQQAVSDGSRAILNAMSIAFNGKSLKEYINFVFETLTTKTKLQPPMMIDCEELSRLEEIVMMTLIVCSTQFQDSIIAIGDRMITPEKARENLEELVARRNPDLTVIDTLEINPDKTMIFEKLSSQATNDKGWSVALLTWIDNLCKKVNTIILIGQTLNTHYVPGLYTDLVDKMKDFPLWTNRARICGTKDISAGSNEKQKRVAAY
ncbi:hypothetical protein PV328_012251 [Microctonus aethiopoides]|uniref:Uncharacterized protein n=1 Tax=Microctonus aethiopoides TaxID=144406 RepID=A0AA39KPT0_9HYME|nr:hypothetical protein PV328_012251 [Microctonus aethiopoides]